MDIDQETNMINEEHQDSSLVAASKRIAQLEAINSALREAVSSKNAHIAMLEEKLTKMSVELASSRTREDEQRLMFRQSQLSQITMMSEDDGGPVAASYGADDCTMKSAAAAAAAQIQPSSSSSTQSRFSFMPNWGSSRTLQDSDTLHDSVRSGGGVGGLIGNMIQLDNSNKQEDLRVNFPTPTERRARRRRTVMTDESHLSASAPPAPQHEQRRMTVVGQLFRRGKSDRTLISKEEQDELQPSRRKPNRTKLLLENQQQSNSRLISSTVAWPTVDDHSAFGFEEFLED